MGFQPAKSDYWDNFLKIIELLAIKKPVPSSDNTGFNF